MKNLKNWDNKTWLSSKNYILCLTYFLEKIIKFNDKIKILDIGCGRGKVISILSKKYKIEKLPLGVDVVKHKDTAKRIRFIKTDALKYLRLTKEKFDLILFKQSIHFFKIKELTKLLMFSKNNLNPKGRIIILSLHPKQNYWPIFKFFKSKLVQSLKRDAIILKIIKSNFKKYKVNYFNFKVRTTRNTYLQMIKNRFTSCLLNLSIKELKVGMDEIKNKYKKKLIFFDKLICISYEKK